MKRHIPQSELPKRYQLPVEKRPSSLKGSAPSYPAPRRPPPAAEYFVPPGYLPLLKAIYEIAKTNNSSLWSDLKPEEVAIYDGLGVTHDLNEVAVDPSELESAPGKRWIELRAAGDALRNALAAEELQAIEHRRVDGHRREMDAQFWTSDAAAEVFVTGARQRTHRLDDCEVRILLSAIQLKQWMDSSSSNRKHEGVQNPDATSERANSREVISRPTKRVVRAKRGRKLIYNWLAVKEKAFELLDEHGDYDVEARKGWSKQADLEEKLLQFMTDELGGEASIGALRADDKLPAWVAEWRQLNVRKGQ
jgi:hypothetical protein